MVVRKLTSVHKRCLAQDFVPSRISKIFVSLLCNVGEVAFAANLIQRPFSA